MHDDHVTRDGDARARVVAIALLGIAAMGIWLPSLGSGVLWASPMLVLACWIVARGPLPQSSAFQLSIATAIPMWVILAVLLAGLPASVFSPGEFGNTTDAFARGILGLRGSGGNDPWVLAAWMIIAGVSWLVGAVHAARPHRASVALAFFLLCIPFATAMLFRQAGDAPWHGAVVLCAALLWATRSQLRGTLPAIGVVALVAVVLSLLIGPSEPKIAFAGFQPPGTGGLDSRQTYGPHQGNFGGSTMFEVRASQGRLWRMEVLGWFNGTGWDIDPRGDDNLPQPAAVPTETAVTIRGLRDDRVSAPGRVLSAVTPTERSRLAGGEAAAFQTVPGSGDTYRVMSEVVDPPLDDLAGTPVPTGPQYDRYKALSNTSPTRTGASLVDSMGELILTDDWQRVYTKAAELSEGTTSQLEIVENVQKYLTEGGRFRYSLDDVPEAGSQPLVDFLLRSKVGYCQHFAGAAALLLRIAGVPVRVVTGFGTGEPTGKGTFVVRDEEAHAWIEVYFPGTGWVPFDPTPPGGGETRARVDPSVGVPQPAETPQDQGRSADGSGSGSGGPSRTGVLALLLLAVAGTAAFVVHRLRTPSVAEPLGEVLVRLVPAPAGPALTLSEMRPDLRRIGPAVAALADRAEHARFVDASAPAEPRPKRAVFKALLSDIGLWNTLKLMMLGPGRRPVVDDLRAAADAASIAPPGSSVAPPGISSAPPGA